MEVNGVRPVFWAKEHCIYTIQVEIHSLAEKGDRIKTILLFVLIAGIAFVQYATASGVHRQRLLYQGGLLIITLKE